LGHKTLTRWVNSAERLPLAYSALCFNGIWVPSKITVFPLEACPKLWT